MVLAADAELLTPQDGPHQEAFVIERDPWQHELDTTRAQLAGLNDMQEQMLLPYVRSLFPHGLRDYGVGSHARVGQALAEGDDGMLGDFLARHHERLALQRHDPNVSGAFDLYKGSYVRRLRQGIQEGWVSPHADEGTLDTIQKVRLEVGDMRTTRLQWKVGQFIGYANKVIIAQGISERHQQAELIENIRDTLPHELSHRFGRWLPRWASEALAEQLGLVVQHGRPEVFHPELRGHLPSIYYTAETTLMHTLLSVPTANAGELSKMALRAFTSDRPDGDEWSDFHEALDLAWQTKDVFKKVTARLESLEAATAAAHPDWISWQVQPEATKRLTDELLTEPQAVFAPHKKPRSHLGAAAIARIKR